MRVTCWVPALLLGLCSWGCGSDSGGNGGAACSDPTPCGGTLDGTWQIDGVCSSNDLAAALNQMSGLPEACNGVFQSAALSGSGSVTFANGTETDDLVQSISAVAVYTPACASAAAGMSVVLSASACSTIQQGIASSGSTASCSFTGGNCRCAVTFQQSSTESRDYTISGSTLSYTNGDDPFDYCVNGSTFSARQVQTDLGGAVFVYTLHK